MSKDVHASVHAKDVDRLRRAIAAGGDVNERARSPPITPLHVAARNGILDCMELLLDNGAIVNAPGNFGSTPLYDACDYKQEAAARLLLARGASANLHGDRGRTPLHVAIKRGLVSVVREMLDAGAADPSIPSRGGDHDTMSYIKRSSASKSERLELTNLIPQYVSLETAIASGNPNIIEAIVKRAFAANDIGAAILVYMNAVPHHPGLGVYRLRLLIATIHLNRPDVFQRLLYAGIGDARTMPLKELLNQTRFEGDQVQTTALHIAAFYGHLDIIKYLVNTGDMDPEICDALGRCPIQVVTDEKDPTGQVRILLTQLSKQRRFRRFTERLLSCTSSDGSVILDPEHPGSMLLQLESLTETMSSVRDVRILFNVGSATLSQHPDQFKQLLTRAFTQLIQDKLVVDDREALLFKMVLRECERRRLLSEAELQYWDLQRVQVNMESAVWARALQRSLSHIQWRVDDVERHTESLRQQYRQLTQAIQHAKSSGAFSQTVARLRNLLSVFSAVLSLAGVDVASQVLDAIVDLSDPLNTLATTYEITVADQLPSFVDDPEATGPLPVRAAFAPVLQRAGIDPTDLAILLREAILLERDHLQNTQKSEKQEAFSNVKEEKKKREIEDEPESDLEQFPFHYAIAHSGGDLQKFLDVVAFIEEDPASSTRNANAVVLIPHGTSSRQFKVRGPPAVLASHFGYVDITKYFLDHKDDGASEEKEKKFVTIQRAYAICRRRKV